MKNYIFYHCTTINDFYERFLKTFSKIESSGLINKLEKFFVFVNGSTEKNLLLHDKINLINYSLHPNESKTINQLRNFCIENKDCNILYLHCKGVTKQGNQNVQSWIEMMEYFLIEKHERCIADLSNFDALGTNFGGSPPHFSGNFWWATSNYISKLNQCKDSYYAPEMWVLSKHDANKIKCYFKTSKNLYYQSLQREEYEY